MFQFSDSESKDSEDGIRFKTDSTRDKSKTEKSKRSSTSSTRRRSTNESRRESSSADYRKHSRRSRSSDRRRHRRSRERSPRVNIKIKRSSKANHLRSYSSDSLSLSDEEVHRKKYPLKKSSSNIHRKRRSSSKHRDSSSKQTDDGKASTRDRADENKRKRSIEARDTHRSGSGDTINKSNCQPIALSSDQVCNSTLGPALPPHLLNTSLTTEGNSTRDIAVEQKALHMVSESNSRKLEKSIIGPYLPPHVKKHLLENPSREDSVKVENKDSDNDDVYGPLPPGLSSTSKAHTALEERALQMKLNSLNPKEKIKGREEWMLELPEVKAANLGLGSRHFRSKIGPDLSDR